MCSAGRSNPACSALAVHIADVIELRAEKQVTRIAARRVVAAVKGAKSVWDLLCVIQLPRDPRRSIFLLPDAENAVAARVAISCPRSAFLRLANRYLSPEAILERQMTIRHAQRSPFQI